MTAPGARIPGALASRILSGVAFVSFVGCAGAAVPPAEQSPHGPSVMKEKPTHTQLAQGQPTQGQPTQGQPVPAQEATPTTTEGSAAEVFKVTGDAEARRLAEQHVALKQYGWGRPTSVSEHAGQYIVTFETPERERVLIGNRAVIVDRKSAVVSVQKRR